MKQFTRLFALLVIFIGFSTLGITQLDNIHYFPPLHSTDGTGLQAHYIYLSTPSPSPVTVNITDGGGNLISTHTISQNNPDNYHVGTGQYAGSPLFVPEANLYMPLQNKGLIVSSVGSESFFAEVRVQSSSVHQASAYTGKGRAAFGKTFRIGTFPQSSYAAVRNFTIGIISTSDNNTITFSQLPNGVQFQTSTGISSPGSPFSITLNAGESFVLVGKTNVNLNLSGIVGALVQASEDIVVTNGNFTGSIFPTTSYQDYGVDQIVPIEKLGTDHVVIEGNGVAGMEIPFVVAHFDNTEIFINGSSTPIATINAGQFYKIPNANYQGTGHRNMYIQTSKPAYVYQALAGSGIEPAGLATGDYNLIPPLHCRLIHTIDLIPDINKIGNTTYDAGIFIVAVNGATTSVNGVPLTGGVPVVGGDYVTYKVTGVSGHQTIASTDVIQAGFFGFSNNASYSGYYSGFADTPVPDIVTSAQDICLGEDINFEFSIADGDPDYAFNYTFQGNSYSATTSDENITQTIDGSNLAPGTYSVILDSIMSSNLEGNASCWYNAFDTLKVIVHDLPNINAGLDVNTCLGSEVTLTVTGSPNNTYSWNNGVSDGVPFVPSVEGEYIVTAISEFGCENTDTLLLSFITEPDIDPGNDTAICLGEEITLTASSSISLTYTWDNGIVNGQPFTPTATQTYEVTGVDASGCEGTATVTITVNSLPNITATVNNATCGEENGSIIAIASDGDGNYTYSWAPNGENSAAITDLGAGTYTLTVSDGNNCESEEEFIITASNNPVISLDNQQDVTVFGGSNGSATVSATGGTPTYTYSWSPSGGNDATATGLSAGTYTVTVTDDNGCTDEITVTILEPDDFEIEVTGTDSHCDLENGTATVSITSGDLDLNNYTFNWSPSGQTTLTATTLTPGTYTVTVTHISGNEKEEEITIGLIEGPSITIDNQENPACNAGNDGSIEISIANGTAPYTILWSSGGNAVTETNLAAGTYTVTVTDDAGCTTQEEIILTAPDAIVLTTTSTDATCDEDNGSAEVDATGGAGNYTFVWSPSGGTDALATDLAADTYTVTVTDENGCSEEATVTINAITPPSIAIDDIENVNCFAGTDGTATVSAIGGTGNYTFTWPSGNTSATETDLAAGTYTVIVTDEDGCTDAIDVVITEPDALTATLVGTDSNCDLDNGSATVSPTGGTGLYTFVWSSGGTTDTETDLSPGEYSVTITDENGCSIEEEVTIDVIPGPAITLEEQNDISCNGLTDGSIEISITNGTAPYTILWSSGGNAVTENNLAAGTYTVTVTDDAGCTTQEEIILTEPDAIVLTTTSTDATCGEDNGSAEVDATGGAGNYTFVWSPSGGTDALATDLAADTYTVTVTDENGCSEEVTVTIDEITPPSIAIDDIENVNCFAGTDGTATVSAIGGTGNYTFTWPSGNTSATETDLAAGTYNVIVTDEDGCTDAIDVVITEPDALTATLVGTDSNCDLDNGSATVSPTGGTGLYTFVWSSGGTTDTETDLSPGEYSVTITDENGCSIEEEVSIDVIPGPAITLEEQNDISCNGLTDGSVEISIANGTAPYTILWSSGGNAVTETDLAAGTYTVTVTDDAGCTTQEEIILTEPDAIVLTTTSTDATCGEDNGSAEVDATGGAGNYTFVWSPSGGTDALATDLAADTYTVTVTDENGCSEEATVTINAITPPSIAIDDIENVNCFAGTDGTATVSAIGGTGNYTFTWPSGNTSATETDLAAGTYTVIVTDEDGCTDAIDVVITEPTEITYNITTTETPCNADAGTATVTVNGGSPTYTFLWSNGATTATATGLSAGEHTLTITDNAGCQITASVTITQINPPIVNIQDLQNISCNDANDGSITVDVVNGTGPFTYTWSPAVSTSNSATDLAAGTYTITVTDDNGCTDEITANITNPSAIVVTGIIEDASCGQTDGSIELNVSGGTAPYNFNWTPNLGNTDFVANLEAGDYSVLVSDGMGCTATATFTIDKLGTFFLEADPSVVEIPLGDAVDIELDIDNNIVVDEITWTPTTGLSCTDCPNPTASPEETTTYYVEVTSADGCVAYDTVVIIVDIPCGEFYVPNVFSPNGDGQNDVFCPLSNCMVALKMEIYNRWGERVFSTTNPKECWDGTSNGEAVQAGVYAYTLEAVMKDGEVIKQSGNVTVVR